MNNELLLFVLVVSSCYLIVSYVHYFITTPPKKIVADIYENLRLTLKFWIYFGSVMSLFMVSIILLGEFTIFAYFFIILIIGLFPKQIKGVFNKKFLRKKARRIFREMRRVKPMN